MIIFLSLSFMYASFVGCDVLHIVGFNTMDGDYTCKFISMDTEKYYEDRGLYVFIRNKSCEWSVKEIGFEYPSYVSSNCGYTWELKYDENVFEEINGLTMSCASSLVDVLIAVILLLFIGFFVVGFLTSCFRVIPFSSGRVYV